MNPCSDDNSDDSWMTEDEMISSPSNADESAAGGTVTMSGKIVRDLRNGWETLPIMGHGSGETATIVTESIDVKHRYELLSPDKLDKQGHPTTENKLSEFICKTNTGKRFLGMLVEQSITPDDSQPAIAMLSKKAEIARGQALVKNSKATEAMLCKWASNIALAPEEVRKAVIANHGYLMPDYLVSKRNKTNAARKEKTSGERKRKQTKISGTPKSASMDKKDKEPAVSVQNTSAINDPANAEKAATSTKAPTAAAKGPSKDSVLPPRPSKMLLENASTERPSKRRRVITVTISDATAEDLALLSKAFSSGQTE